jgi:hypothetical protein
VKFIFEHKMIYVLTFNLFLYWRNIWRWIYFWICCRTYSEKLYYSIFFLITCIPLQINHPNDSKCWLEIINCILCFSKARQKTKKKLSAVKTFMFYDLSFCRQYIVEARTHCLVYLSVCALYFRHFSDSERTNSMVEFLEPLPRSSIGWAWSRTLSN